MIALVMFIASCLPACAHRIPPKHGQCYAGDVRVDFHGGRHVDIGCTAVRAEIDSVGEFWARVYGESARNLRVQIIGFVAEWPFYESFRPVAAVSIDGQLIIGNAPTRAQAIELLRHELGHAALLAGGVAYDEGKHHEIFRQHNFR